MTEAHPTIDRSTLSWGLLLLASGLLLGLSRLDLLDLSPSSWWPLAPILVASGHLLSAPDRKHRRLAAWFLLIGLWLLVNSVGLFGFSWPDSWPLLVIGGGLVDVLWPTPSDDRYDGLVWAAAGVWMLAVTRHWLALSWRDSWPVLLVLFGLAMLLKALLQGFPALTGRRQS